jgi:hypothetical protein
VSAEVVEHHPDASRIRVVLIEELAHLLNELDFGSLSGHIDVPPADQRFTDYGKFEAKASPFRAGMKPTNSIQPPTMA